MADQRIDLRFGGVSVEVSLQKTSGKPREAKHDTRRMIGDELAEVARAEALRKWSREHDVKAKAQSAVRDGYTLTNEHSAGETVIVEMKTEADRDTPTDPRVGAMQAEAYRELVEAAPDPFADLPPERVEQGVYRPIGDESQAVQDFCQDGEWVDLTDRLAEIDKRTRIDGLEVVAAISSSAVPRHRVRDSYWIGLAPDAAGTPKVLALLWRALRVTRRAAVVKWTKRTNQALGIIVAGEAHLALLEIEWSANMRKPGVRVTTPLLAPVSVNEDRTAVALVEALAEPPAFLDSIRDERTAKRAELLEAARAGKVDEFEPPPEPDVQESDLAAMLGAGS